MPSTAGLKERKLNARGGNATGADQHTQRGSASSRHRPTHPPRTTKMPAEPRSEARAGGGDPIRAGKPHGHGDTRHRQREPTENARPPEHTNHGSSRWERGTNRRGRTDHGTKIRKNKAHPPQANPQKGHPNPEKSRPNRKKEASATHREPTRKPTTNDKRSHHPTHPLCVKIRDRHDDNRTRRRHYTSGGRRKCGPLARAACRGNVEERRPRH